MGKLVDKIEDSERRIEGLGEELREEMHGALNRVVDSLSQRAEVREQCGDALEALVEVLRKELVDVKGELAICKAAATRGAIAIQPARVDVPRPKEFKGERSAKEVDNFLWSMEQYFGVLGVYDDDSKVRTASIYLIDIAMLWWRRRCEEGRCNGKIITT